MTRKDAYAIAFILTFCAIAYIALDTMRPQPKHYMLPASEYHCTDREPNRPCAEYRRF